MEILAIFVPEIGIFNMGFWTLNDKFWTLQDKFSNFFFPFRWLLAMIYFSYMKPKSEPFGNAQKHDPGDH